MEPAGQARLERRLAAILAAAVAGYSRLIEADEEGTLGRLKTLRRELFDPKIAEYHGRIVKTTLRPLPARLCRGVVIGPRGPPPSRPGDRTRPALRTGTRLGRALLSSAPS